MTEVSTLKSSARRRFTSVHQVLSIWAVLILMVVGYNLYTHYTAGTPILGQIFGAADALQPSAVACEPLEPIPGDKTVILRVDDIQAWAWASTTRMMIEDAEARNMPLTLGIIPRGFRQDTSLVQFLQDRDCRHEFALHGFDHQSYGENDEIAEFERRSKADAKRRIGDGLKELEGVTKQSIRTWIPPLNVHSTGTQEALNEAGLTRWSTEGEALWDYDASTYSYDVNQLVATDDVLADCEATLVESDVCIIMLHPQDFTTNDWHDAEKYDQYYLDLLDRLYGKGYSFGTFTSVAESA